MRRKQRGITFIGWLFLLAPAAVVVYAGMRLMPIYLNHMRVVKTLDQTATELKGGSEGVSQQSIRTAIANRFNIESVDSPTAEDILIRRDGKAWVIEAQYEGVAPLFANISIHVDFDKVVQVE
jgi:hypothetical protein